MSNILDRRHVRGSMLAVDNLYGTAFTGEENAHVFRITDYEGSAAVAFTGEIAGKFINPAGVTVPLSGSLDGDGRAVVTLDEHCYAVEGRFILTIWAGSEVIYCGVGQVMNSQTDTIDYPTAGIPDVAALIQQLQTILNNWPADYSQLQSDVSNLKSAVAYKDGAYPDLTSGNAEQLLSTTGVTDKVPYLFRPSAGDGADREQDKIVGGTVAWNQIFPNVNSEIFSHNMTNPTITKDETNNTVSVSSTVPSLKYWYLIDNGVTGVYNHVYYISFDFKAVTNTPTTVWAKACNNSETVTLTYNGDGAYNYISKIMPSTFVGHPIFGASYSTAGDSFTAEIKNPVLIDLTTMFGTTIADYIETLENANAGSGIALLKSWGYFTKPYYAYNAGSLQSVNTSAHEMVGFNQWDEEWELGTLVYGVNDNSDSRIRSKNYNPCLPNTTYYLACSNTGYGNLWISYYNANKQYLGGGNANGYAVLTKNSTFTTPADAYFFRFQLISTTVYNYDICINLSCSRNGEYQPYVKRTYALDSDLTLRGIPKLDSNNKLYYDGDTYEADGTVTRRFGVVDLGTLTWTQENASTGQFMSVNQSAMKYAGQLVSAKWSNYTGTGTISGDKIVGVTNAQSYPILRVIDSAYANYTADQFKTAMSGVYLVYELATPTTETADPFQTPQILDPYGTEAYIDTRDVPIPVGHETFYPENLRAKLDNMPTWPTDDGEYLVSKSGNNMSCVPLASSETIENLQTYIKTKNLFQIDTNFQVGYIYDVNYNVGTSKSNFGIVSVSGLATQCKEIPCDGWEYFCLSINTTAASPQLTNYTIYGFDENDVCSMSEKINPLCNTVYKFAIPSGTKYITMAYLTRTNTRIPGYTTGNDAGSYYDYVMWLEKSTKKEDIASSTMSENIFPKNRIINCLGDSITYGFVPSANAQTNPQMTNNYPKILGELLDCKVNNYGISASTISKYGSEGYTTGYWQPFAERYTEMDKNADIIIVFGGTNDYSNNKCPLGNETDTSLTTFYGSLNTLISGLVSTYMNSAIMFVTPIRRADMTSANSAGLTLEDYSNAIIKVCNKYGIPVLNGYTDIPFTPADNTFNTTFCGDRIHPNQLFAEYKLAPIIANFIKSKFWF